MSAGAWSNVDNRRVAAQRIASYGRFVEVFSLLLLILAFVATVLIASEADLDEHTAGTVGSVIATGLELVTPAMLLFILGVWAQSYGMTRLGELDQR